VNRSKTRSRLDPFLLASTKGAGIGDSTRSIPVTPNRWTRGQAGSIIGEEEVGTPWSIGRRDMVALVPTRDQLNRLH
jgi:hypothetical protein